MFVFSVLERDSLIGSGATTFNKVLYSLAMSCTAALTRPLSQFYLIKSEEMPGTMIVQNHVVNQQRLTHGKRDYCTLHAWKGRPAYVSCSFNALCHVSSMSCIYHIPCIKHVSINTFHVYIKIFLLDKFLSIS